MRTLPDGDASIDSGVLGEAETVAILLPVRDEETNLLPCLDGLLAQRFSTTPAGMSLERGQETPRVLVIDDGSGDGTRHLAAARAAREPRLEVIGAGPLPDGWGGKVHALERGRQHLVRSLMGGEGGSETTDPARTTASQAAPAQVGAAPPAWVLTTDADTRHHPDLLARALAAARQHDLDLLSIAGHQESRGFAENLLTPPVFALLDLLLGDWRPVARGEGPTLVNGQYMLFRGDLLERIGGFAAARGAAIDDLAMARAVRSAGGRTGFVRAPDLLRVRMYRGPAAVFRGWRRNLGGLFGGRPGLFTATLAALCGPPLLAVLSRRAGAGLSGIWVSWALGAAASAWLRASSGQRSAWGLLYPLDALALAATLARGATDYRRGQLEAWKGRPVAAR